jgi:hypothetical protein
VVREGGDEKDIGEERGGTREEELHDVQELVIVPVVRRRN